MSVVRVDGPWPPGTPRNAADVRLELPGSQDRVLTVALIARGALADGRSAVYVTSDELVNRTMERLGELDPLPAVNLHSGLNGLRDLVDYYNGRALGVLGFSTYFSARPRIDPADLVLLDADRMDDGVIGALFMVRVDRHLQPRAYEELRDLVAGPGRVITGALDPAVWASVADCAGDLLTRLLCGEAAQFVWLRLQPFLGECEVTIGRDDIEIRPPRALLPALPGYRHAGQRVHLSTKCSEPAVPAQASPVEPDTAGLSPSVRYAVKYLRGCFADPDLTLDRVASAAYMSRYHFSRSFREQTGLRFIDFVTQLRMDEARLLLRKTDTSITDVARAVGYRELSHFQRMFKKRFGVSASGYRAGAGRADLLLA